MSNSKPDVFTECKSCIFEKDLDCTLDKLQLFKQNGGNVQIKDGHVFIGGRQCNFKRNNDWFLKYQDSIEEQLTIETNIRYGLLIKSAGVETLKKAIDFALKQSILPKAIYIVYNNEDFDSKIAEINTLLHNTNIKWYIKKPLEDEKHEFDYINEYISTSVVKEGYILYIRDTNIPQNNLIQKINYSINTLLKQVMVYCDFDYVFTSTVLVQIFGLDYLNEAIYNAGHGDKISRVI